MLHSCIGCDYTSSFYGKDKTKALKLNEQFLSAFSDLGISEVVCEETVVSKLNVFTCRLFGDQTATTVNDARYNLFTKGNFGEDCLPPNKDALLLHISRANYVSYIWRRCISPNIDAPNFCNHGWQVDDGEVRVRWLFCLPAMDNIIESSSCNSAIAKQVARIKGVNARKICPAPRFVVALSVKTNNLQKLQIVMMSTATLNRTIQMQSKYWRNFTVALSIL
jgi:hypothetical protein